MKRISVPERPGWKEQAEKLGFGFHTMYGAPYWDETRAYQFTLEEIERDLEDPSQELYGMCLDLVDRVVRDDALLEKMAIPQTYREWIRQSWENSEPSLYGRFDFFYDGTGPAKLLEFNADTPTALYETGFFQWIWLEEQIAAGVIPQNSDQFNSVQDRLIERFAAMFAPGYHIHFASSKDHDEDRATVRYLEDCAKQAGLTPHYVAVEDIGVDAEGRFADKNAFVIDALFKLYPYEDMFREDYGPFLPGSKVHLIEPPWKAILSNKAILPLLWEMFPGHPNLLPSYFDGEAPAEFEASAFVRKPLFSREGANITVRGLEGGDVTTPGSYGEEGHILQAYVEPPKFGDDYAMIGSWIVGGIASGILIREDREKITQDLSRFVPHIILDT
ncbi:MAG: glutathionylspermidine synthase family protein [Roseibium sp.]|uniref:glutathionylspermidine synthase family protein n=1 Tax=Roseibium sp. TaxID=1936156 RepID=UPI001B11274C|nr:glutathionylspermidine synthase family protein [Roseibium sp.]MBO6893888.1 glutathionylspermidine synthase family protein [Roseibium sp.]MBO6932393.1 glutathionylspermidine synthase family protein [Roseibium sp.]